MKKQRNAIIGIYKITSPSNKVYIGQSINIYKRWDYYKILKCREQIKLYNSLLKYGYKTHKFEVIEECLENKLDEREYQHKKQFINKYGWKMALFCMLRDGKGGHKSEETKHKIGEANKGKTKPKDFGEKISKPVLQYDLDGKFIKEWESLTKASKELKLLLSGISETCHGKKIKHGNFIWELKIKKQFSLKIRVPKYKSRGKNVYQYDLNWKFIKKWKSSWEAGKKLGIESTNIKNSIEKGHKAKNYYWKYYKIQNK